VALGWYVPDVLVIGLTGGVGSGKSSVAEVFARHGAVVVDTDAVARRVVEPGTIGLEAIRARFGREVLRDGELDRAALAALVFSDEDALADLNGIVHPLVRAEVAQEVSAHASEDVVVVLVVPLLVESAGYEVDRVIVVDCDEDVAVRRLVAQRGWSERHARQRIAAQAGRPARRAAADLVIDNSGPIEDLAAVAEHAWRWIEEQRPVVA